jgi:hypothetical protein
MYGQVKGTGKELEAEAEITARQPVVRFAAEGD